MLDSRTFISQTNPTLPFPIWHLEKSPKVCRNLIVIMSSTISQLSCFSSIHRRSYPCLNLRPKVLVVMSHGGRGTEMPSSESKTTLSYTAEDPLKSQDERSGKPYSITEEHVNERKVHIVPEQKRAAKIHDFCFGIPFGGLVFSGGLVGFIFSRNPATLGTGVIFGGALLALSTFSMKIWREGKSSLPFILGQSVLAACLLWKNFQTYLLTKKLFPTGFYAVISAAMLCFYTYVVLSGGNPPPKKLKSSATVPL